MTAWLDRNLPARHDTGPETATVVSPPDWQALAATWSEIGTEMVHRLAAMAPAFQAFGRGLAAMQPAPDRYSHPHPLAIDGHAYSRRRRSRRRRQR